MSSRGDPPPPGGNRYLPPAYPTGSHPQAYHYAMPAQPILPPPPPPGAAPGSGYQQRGRHRPPEAAYPASGEPWQQRSKPYDPSARANLSATAATAHSEAAGSQQRSQASSSQPAKEQHRQTKRDTPIPGVALPSPPPGPGVARSGATGTDKATGGGSKGAGASSAALSASAKGASTVASHNPFAVFATMSSPLPSPSPTPPPGAATATAAGTGTDRPLSVKEVEELMRQQQQQPAVPAAAKDKNDAMAPAADMPDGINVLSMLFGGKPAATDNKAPANSGSATSTTLVQRYSAETLRELNDPSLPPPAGFQAPPMLENRLARTGEDRPEWAAGQSSARRTFGPGPTRYATARMIKCVRHTRGLKLSSSRVVFVRVQAPARPRPRRERCR